jgi:hypothetical protein
MPRGLSDAQIERTTRELLSTRHRVTVRDVMRALRARFGGCGRTERICKVLKQLEAQRLPPSIASSTSAGAEEELVSLREHLRAAEARAELSEERERQHQDLWASRYAEKVAELEKQQPRATHRTSGVTHDQYLRVYQRAVDLARRLARYEDPDKPATNADG